MSGKKRKYAKLSAATWAEIRALWETGEPTLEELSDRYGVAKRTLQTHFSKNGTDKGSKAQEIAAAVTAEVFSGAFLDKETLAKRARATREAAYHNAVVIEALIMAQLEAAQKDASQAIKAASALKALSLAAAGLERLHDLKQKALGLDKDSVPQDELPELVFRELLPAEIAALQGGEDEADDYDRVEGDAESPPRAKPQGHLDQSDCAEAEIEANDEGDEIVVEGNPAHYTPEGFRLVREAT